MDKNLVEKLKIYSKIYECPYIEDTYQIRKLLRDGKIDKARKLTIFKIGEYLKKQVPSHVGIADETVQALFNKALKMVAEIEDPDERNYALESIVRLWIDVDKYEAIKIAMKINDSKRRIDILKYIIYQGALDEIDDDEVLEILDTMIEIIENIMYEQAYDDYDKRLMMYYLIWFLARVDIDKALEIAKKQEPENEKVEMLCEIARSIRYMYPEKANSILNEAINIVRSIDHAYTLACAISAILPNLKSEEEIYEMLELARNIEDDYARKKVLGKIAEYLVDVDMNKALEIVNEIDDKEYRNNIIENIVLILIKKDMDIALKFARMIDDSYKRDYLLYHLSEIIADINVPEALKIVREIEDKRQKIETFIKIALKIANDNAAAILADISNEELGEMYINSPDFWKDIRHLLRSRIKNFQKTRSPNSEY